MAHDTHGSSHAKALPADLGAPAFVDGWRSRAIIVAAVAAVVAVILAILGQTQDHLGWDHFMRAWMLGLVFTFGWSVGGLALLMVQYVSGGKWGLLLRRPLEAASQGLWLVLVYWFVSIPFLKYLYQWAMYTNVSATAEALKNGLVNEAQAHALNFKRPMLNPTTYLIVMAICFAIWIFYTWRLRSLSIERDRQSPDTTPFWIKKLENVSGPGIVVYSLTMTAAVIYWVMSMDVTWFSSVYGLLFLVGEGYSVLALSILTSISLSKAEPFRTILRTTEQHDLGKFTFAFVMLNIYLGFAQFLIIWSGNLP